MSFIAPEELQKIALNYYNDTKDKDLTNKDRREIPIQEMPAQNPDVRRKNIEEVAIGYSAEQAVVEAKRCIQCKNAPCVAGCPVGIDIPGFLRLTAEENFQDAVNLIKESSLLPAICGRVCPQEAQCMKNCTVGKLNKDPEKSVAIGRVERFVADWERSKDSVELPKVKPSTGKKVAIVGSGPAGLAAAADIRKEGHAVTIFEALPAVGGVMTYGIPEFRLPKDIVKAEIANLEKMGIVIKKNILIGRTHTVEELLETEDFDAVFIGSGAGLPKFMGIEGENLVGVFSANEYLTRANLMKAFDKENADTPSYPAKKVAVLGGGNVAMDAARTALRLGAEEVTVIYRRTELEMPARREEILHAKEEGIKFMFLSNAKRIIGDDQSRVTQIECVKYELGEPDDSGRRRPIEIPNSEFKIDMDAVIPALGNNSNPLISQTTPTITTTKRGNIIVDNNQKTSMDGVYAGGDIVLGAATVILAMGEGRKAAKAINETLV
ncbi:MAG: glutamate synthase (NADPH), homotetrameric [Spirochaetaceae bacterium 4572_7]|nr:MAG: glutamate synthase (NADPH), homotetrameric [Spirochaetaceae bacterium 4572_7]